MAEEPFEAAGRKFNRGSFIIRNAPAADVQAAGARARPAGRTRVASAPAVKTHPVQAPRIALHPHLAQHAGRGLVAAWRSTA